MTERESEATCNFTPSADGLRDYFVRQRKQMEKARIELFGCNDLTESPIISLWKKKKLPRLLSLIRQTTGTNWLNNILLGIPKKVLRLVKHLVSLMHAVNEIYAFHFRWFFTPEACD